MLGSGLIPPLRIANLPVGAPASGPGEPMLYCPSCFFQWSGQQEAWRALAQVAPALLERDLVCTSSEHPSGVHPALRLTSRVELARLAEEAQEARDAAEFGPAPLDRDAREAFLLSASRQVLEVLPRPLNRPERVPAATGFFADGLSPQTAYRRLRFAVQQYGKEDQAI